MSKAGRSYKDTWRGGWPGKLHGKVPRGQDAESDTGKRWAPEELSRQRDEINKVTEARSTAEVQVQVVEGWARGWKGSLGFSFL